MNSAFLVKEGYSDYEVRDVCSTLEMAKRAAEMCRGSYTTLCYIIEEWEIDGETSPRNVWQLEGNELRQLLKDGEYVPYDRK